MNPRDVPRPLLELAWPLLEQLVDELLPVARVRGGRILPVLEAADAVLTTAIGQPHVGTWTKAERRRAAVNMVHVLREVEAHGGPQADAAREERVRLEHALATVPDPDESGARRATTGDDDAIARAAIASSCGAGGGSQSGPSSGDGDNGTGRNASVSDEPPARRGPPAPAVPGHEKQPDVACDCAACVRAFIGTRGPLPSSRGDS